MLFEQQYRLPERLPAGAVVLDAGANIGIMALLLRSRYPDAELHAFEPFPANARLLRMNLAGLPRTHVHELALSDTNGDGSLHGGAHDAEHSLVDTRGGGADTTVRVVRLDAWLDAQGIDRVALMKVDVEGSEQALIDGLGARLGDVDVFVGEFHETMVDEVRFYDQLTRAGFTVRHRDKPLDGGPVHMFRVDNGRERA
jgi:FkbM family methyltransferase